MKNCNEDKVTDQDIDARVAEWFDDDPVVLSSPDKTEQQLEHECILDAEVRRLWGESAFKGK